VIGSTNLVRDADCTVTYLTMFTYALEAMSEEDIHQIATTAVADVGTAMANSFEAAKRVGKRHEKAAIKKAACDAFKALGVRAAPFAYEVASMLPEPYSQSVRQMLDVVFEVGGKAREEGVAIDDVKTFVNAGISKSCSKLEATSKMASKNDLKDLEIVIKAELDRIIEIIKNKPGGLATPSILAPPPIPFTPPPILSSVEQKPPPEGASLKDKLFFELKQKIEERKACKERVLTTTDLAIMDEGEKGRHDEREASKKEPESVESLKAAVEAHIIRRRNACNEDGED